MLWVDSAAAYWTFEHGRNHLVHSFGDALTVTTVGYGDVTPVTQREGFSMGFSFSWVSDSSASPRHG
jgi:hypothetical protein